LVTGEPKRLKLETGCVELDGIFKVTVLRLEVVRTQMHAL
jgi:hypothetical protein